MNFAKNETLVQIVSIPSEYDGVDVASKLYGHLQISNNKWPGTEKVSQVVCGVITNFDDDFLKSLHNPELDSWFVHQDDADDSKIQSAMYILFDGDEKDVKEEAEKILRYAKSFYVSNRNYPPNHQLVRIAVLEK